MSYAFIFLGGLIWGAAFGAVWAAQQVPSLEACARQHNVYQCELIAVPAKDPRP